MTPEELKNKRYNFLKESIIKYVSSEPKLTEADLAYLIWELHDFNYISAEKLIKAIKKELKT